MEFLAGVVFVVFVGAVATRVLRKKYKIVKREQPVSPGGSGGGGGGSRPDIHPH